MKKYGEYFVNEDGSWIARWYEGNKVVDSKQGNESTEAKANEKASAWLKTKGGK